MVPAGEEDDTLSAIHVSLPPAYPASTGCARAAGGGFGSGYDLGQIAGARMGKGSMPCSGRLAIGTSRLAPRWTSSCKGRAPPALGAAREQTAERSAPAEASIDNHCRCGSGSQGFGARAANASVSRARRLFRVPRSPPFLRQLAERRQGPGSCFSSAAPQTLPILLAAIGSAGPEREPRFRPDRRLNR